MSHHPYYARAPLGQDPSPLPVVPVTSASMVLASPVVTLYRVAGLAAGAALAYHGMKRNNGSIGWAIAWAVIGGFAWPVGLGIAYAQGFGRAALRRNRRRH